MVARLFSRFVLVLGLCVVPASAPAPRGVAVVVRGASPRAVRPVFSRRRSATHDEESQDGEFVHAIGHGRAARPLGIVQA
jgi:hypothetical protein